MEGNKKVSHAEFIQFLKEYDNGLHPFQRLGQAFMNKYDIGPDQKLFYYQRRGNIIKHIELNYINY